MESGDPVEASAPASRRSGATGGARERWRRRGIRLVAGSLICLVVLTLASLAYNAATVPPPTLAPLSGRDVQAGGVRVHYEQWGERGRPVVLVHGFAESTVAWEPAARELARTHVVYALDLAGYGYTERTGRYALDDQVALVDGFLHALSLDRPVVVGHSLGAAVVGGLALRHPADVGGVIFLDGDALPFSDRPRSRRGGDPLTLPYAVSALRLVTRSSWLGERLIAAQCGSPCRGLTPELADAWLRPMRQGEAEAALPAMLRAGLLALTPDEVRAISVPRAIVWGAEDPRSGGSLEEARRNLGDPPTRIIPGAGHLSMVADPGGVARAVDELTAGMP